MSINKILATDTVNVHVLIIVDNNSENSANVPEDILKKYFPHTSNSVETIFFTEKEYKEIKKKYRNLPTWKNIIGQWKPCRVFKVS